MNRPGLRARKRKIALAVGGVLAVVAAAAGFTNGFGLTGGAVNTNQRVNSASGTFTISSTNVAGDPGGTAITETVNNMYDGDYRERLVTITPAAGNSPAVGISVTGIVNSDATTSLIAGVNTTPDAINLLAGSNDDVTPGQPGGTAAPGQGGLYVELYSCGGTWSSAAGAVSTATDDRDYTCSAGGNGTLAGSYDVGAASTSVTQWVVPPVASATTFLLRTRFVADSSNTYQQTVLSNEQVTLTHRFDAGLSLPTTALARTMYHGCLVKTDSTIWCWGYNGSGELGDGTTTNIKTPTRIGSTTTWATVSTGGDHTCAIQTNGTLWCTGANYYGQLGLGDNSDRTTFTQVGVATDWTTVSAGNAANCATKTGGTLWCWGNNLFGELGDGTTTDRWAPTQVGIATDWAAVRTELTQHPGKNASTCARKTTRTLWCWGDNSYGQLGDGTTTQRLTPTQVGVATSWDTFGTGLTHTCATRTNGTLWCWGNNGNGQLGDGTNTQRLNPTQIGVATDWAIVDAGKASTCATKTTGTLWCAGANYAGQLGTGTATTGTKTAPTAIASSSTFTNVSVNDQQEGVTNSCAVRSDATLWCWGYNGNGRLGDGTSTNRSTPTQAGVATNWASVSAGQYHVCAVRTNGTLWCWGSNAAGQLGDGTKTDQYSPIQIGVATNWAAVSSGRYGTCARQTNNTIWCWGANYYGMLGQGDTTERLTPTQVGVGTNWASVSTHWHSTCGTKSDGTLWCWGVNWYGTLGLGDTTQRLTPTQVGVATTWAQVVLGSFQTCATRTDGTLWCWGYNGYGSLGDGTTTDRLAPIQVGVATDWLSVAPGYDQTCGIKTTNILWCWGANWYGGLGTGDRLQSLVPRQVGVGLWTMVTPGFQSSCGLDTSAKLYCWGYNALYDSFDPVIAYAALGNGDNRDITTFAQVGTATNWSSVVVGSESACALDTSSTTWCWGDNRYRQLGVGDTVERASPNIIGGPGNGRVAGAA